MNRCCLALSWRPRPWCALAEPQLIMADSASAFLFTREQLSGSSSSGLDFDLTTGLALLVFVGTVVFCGVQALWNPRRTFCAELNGAAEPATSSGTSTVPTARRRTRKAD